MKTFHIWANGDRTVGDGTFSATMTTDPFDVEADEAAVKRHLGKTLACAWDIRQSDVHVMTDEEWKAWTKEHVE